MVSNEWQVKRLGEVAELQRGFDLPSSQRIEGNIPIISSSGVTGFHNEYKVQAPGVVTGRYGSIGEVFFIEEKFWPLNTSLWVKDFHGNYEKFIYYLLKNFDFDKFSDKTGVPGVNRNDLHSVKVPVPPLAEQKKIAEILSTWDKAIETVEKLVTNSQQQKKALMQQLLTVQKRLLDNNGVKFGSEWEVIPIASTFKLITDYVASGSFASLKDNVNVSDDEGFAHYVRQTDLAAKFKNTNLKWVDENSYKYLSKSNLYEGDILFTNIGDLGRVYYMPKLEKPATVAPNLVVLRTNEKNNSKFIFYLLESDVGQQEINKIKSGTGLPKISKTEFKTMAFSIPALEEQEKIAQVLTLADREIDLYQQQLDKLKLEKKSLMQQLLTGQKRVKID